MDGEATAPAERVTVELAYNLLRMLLLAAVVIGAMFARGCTNWHFRHHYLPSELFVDSGRVIFVQPDGSFTAIRIADGAVLARLFAEKANLRAAVHTTFLADNDKLIADAAGQTLVLDRDRLQIRSATGTPVPPRRYGFESGNRYSDAYDGSETPEYKWNLTDEERRELGLPPIRKAGQQERFGVFPGQFIFNISRDHDFDTGGSPCRISYTDKDGSWSGDVSYLGRDWFNSVDRIHITENEILIAATYGQLECLDRKTGRTRWLYVFPTKRYFLSTGVWDFMSWDSFYTSQKRRYDRELHDTRQRGTILDGDVGDSPHPVIINPKPANFYFWRTVLAYAIVYIPLASLVVFLAHMAIALLRRPAVGERVGWFVAGHRFSLFAMGWHCVFLSFAAHFFLLYFFHVSRIASGLFVLAGAVSWVIGVCLFVASRRERKALRSRVAGWLMAVLCLAFAGFFGYSMIFQLLNVS